ERLRLHRVGPAEKVRADIAHETGHMPQDRDRRAGLVSGGEVPVRLGRIAYRLLRAIRDGREVVVEQRALDLRAVAHRPTITSTPATRARTAIAVSKPRKLKFTRCVRP